MTRDTVARRMEAFRRRCTDLGLALTPQRLAIYEALASDDCHPGAEAIYHRVKPGMPSLSLGTVYRTLELLELHGLISRVHAFDDQARFDANLDDHHHLICTVCRHVFDVQDAALARPHLPEETLHGFRVHSHRIHLLGVCAECQSGVTGHMSV